MVRHASPLTVLLLASALGGCGSPRQESMRLEPMDVASIGIDGKGAKVHVYNAGPAMIGLQLHTVSSGAPATIGATLGPNRTWRRQLEAKSVLRLTNDESGRAANVDIGINGASDVDVTPPSINTGR